MRNDIVLWVIEYLLGGGCDGLARVLDARQDGTEITVAVRLVVLDGNRPGHRGREVAAAVRGPGSSPRSAKAMGTKPSGSAAAMNGSS
jgi:hypothetical protein